MMKCAAGLEFWSNFCIWPRHQGSEQGQPGDDGMMRACLGLGELEQNTLIFNPHISSEPLLRKFSCHTKLLLCLLCNLFQEQSGVFSLFSLLLPTKKCWHHENMFKCICGADENIHYDSWDAEKIRQSGITDLQTGSKNDNLFQTWWKIDSVLFNNGPHWVLFGFRQKCIVSK